MKGEKTVNKTKSDVLKEITSKASAAAGNAGTFPRGTKVSYLDKDGKVKEGTVWNYSNGYYTIRGCEFMVPAKNVQLSR